MKKIDSTKKIVHVSAFKPQQRTFSAPTMAEASVLGNYRYILSKVHVIRGDVQDALGQSIDVFRFTGRMILVTFRDPAAESRKRSL